MIAKFGSVEDLKPACLKPLAKCSVFAIAS